MPKQSLLRTFDDASVLPVFRRLAVRLGTTLDFEHEVNLLLDKLIAATQCQLAALFLVDEDKEHLTLAARRGVETLMPLQVPIGVDLREALTPWLANGLPGRRRRKAQKGEATPPPFCAAPLFIKGQLMGVLCLVGKPEHPRWRAVEDLCSLVASYAAPILDNIQHHHQTEQEVARRTEHLAALYRLGQIVNSSLNLRQVFARFLKEVQNLVPFDRASVVLFDRDGQHYQTVARSWAGGEEVSMGEIRPLAGTALERVLREGTPQLFGDFQDSAFLADIRFLLQEGVRSGVFVPMVLKGTVIGSFNLQSKRPNAFSSADIERLLPVADQLAIAVENARLFHELSQTKAELEGIFNAISDPIFVLDRKMQVKLCNRAAAEMFRMPVENCPGADLWNLMCLQCGVSECPMKATFERGEPMAQELAFEDGKRIFSIQTYPVLDAQGQVSEVVAYARDVTEAKMEEEKMLRLERLRALGEIASGVAHDFSNALMAILGYTEILSQRLEDPSLQKLLDYLMKAADDASNIVQRMQAFYKAHAKPGEQVLVNINHLLQDCLELTRSRWRDRPEVEGIVIELVTDFADVPPIKGNPTELREVFINIILNACDAMPQGGKLMIRTRADERMSMWAGGQGSSEAEQSRLSPAHLLARSPAVVVEVQDTGVGMDEETKKHIFEAFFTTKPNGTGLGMSLAYGIIHRHGGTIEVDSELGKGTVVRVRLPVVSGSEGQAVERGEAKAVRSLRILVIEDDEAVREAITELLRKMGHRAKAAKDGEEGLSLFQPRRFDAVITDWGMPKVNGFKVAQIVKSISPLTPVILLTGWGDEFDEITLHNQGIDAVLHKPISSQELNECLLGLVTKRDKRQKAF